MMAEGHDVNNEIDFTNRPSQRTEKKYTVALNAFGLLSGSRALLAAAVVRPGEADAQGAGQTHGACDHAVCAVGPPNGQKRT